MKIEKPSNPMNEIIQQKVKEFGNKVNSLFDLEVIQAEQQELFRAIQETIDLTTKKKLSDLDDEIQRRKNDHIAKLFGTNNFESWDGDPALSNVSNVKKLQPYKTFVPGDLPLYDKMTMKYEINAMRLKPTRVGNELVFQGNIKEIEKEFQGQELPHPLMEAIKEEKGVICDLVRKYLMPYYNAKRIQTNKVFTVVARKISHHFYGHSAGESFFLLLLLLISEIVGSNFCEIFCLQMRIVFDNMSTIYLQNMGQLRNPPIWHLLIRVSCC